MDVIPGQYATGATREQIARALAAAGKSPDALAVADLAPLEDFRLLGRHRHRQRSDRKIAVIAHP